ncbi:M50 family metallopeptidase [Brachybacterium sp. DNPG3]
MDLSRLAQDVWDRILPGTAPTGGWWVLAAIAVALALVALPTAWRFARLGVTIVHELGHAIAGILMGRRFTGFVVSADMSGHAVTVGPRRGVGRVVSAWAGYPAPALLGAVLVQVALHGWARTALSAALLILLISLIFSRSLHTVATVLVAILGLGAAWWWANPTTTALIVLAAGVFLLVGAWRHVLAVMRANRGADDPAQLAQLTPLPAWAWILSFLLVLAACTWWSWTALAPHLF